MFSGIISDLGEVRAVENGGDTRLVIGTRLDLTDAAIGASIACSGPCLTVIEKGPDWFATMVSAETMACTTLASWQAGTKVNL
jgi:riboflavin synthase